MVEDQQTFKLELHPEAARKLNDQAEALLLEMTSKPSQVMPPLAFTPDKPVKAVFTSETIIGVMETGLIAPGGRQLSRYVADQGKEIGFDGEHYKNFARFCETMQKGNPFRQYVSLDVIENLVFKWAWARYSRATFEPMTDHVVPKCEAEIREYEVWIPISHLHVQTDLMMGEVMLKTFSTAMFDGLRGYYEALDLSDESKTQVSAMLDQMQNRVQGLAAATMFVTAEPRRAYEIALEATEKALAVLRIYSKAAMNPEVSSCCVPYGQKTPQTNLSYLFRNGEVANSFDGVSESEDVMVMVSVNLVKFWAESGMGEYVRLFFEKKKTNFERDVVNSLTIYSRSTLATTPSEKLVFIFSALESLLLRDQSENIQQNVAERIAFTIGKDVNERREIIKTYKDTYKLRSNFVHHGRSIEEAETLGEFMRIVFQFFLSLVVREVRQHKTRDDFLRALEDKKLS